jgi:NDP-sugar pyrophosphorylase family protein
MPGCRVLYKHSAGLVLSGPMKPTLLVLAAGIGSRYGGLKQMDPVGPSGEFIIDYSIYDALRAGFGRVVFVIRDEIEAAVRATIGARVERHVPVTYVRQSLAALPPGFSVPGARVKPWGTGQAVWVCRAAIDEPFGVINADDFYGRDAYRALAEFLTATAARPDHYGMVAFYLRNTLSDHGSVCRGICHTTSDGNLASVTEVTDIEKRAGRAFSPSLAVTGDECVSMNMWAFKPTLFAHLETAFAAFLRAQAATPKAEFFIPTVINDLMRAGHVTTRVLTTDGDWFGVTNPDDRPRVVERIAACVDAGVYPADLWA